MQSLRSSPHCRSPRWSRHFSASCPRTGHYQTLGIPKNATKNQIKASYYKLSKQFHPDVNKDPTAKEKFQAVSEAYAVLGDDRQRRAYDREQTVDYTASHPHTHHEASSAYTHWSYEGRRRGATHAWSEYSRRPNSGRAYTYPPPPGTSHYAHTQQQGPNPFSNPNVQRATGRRGPLPSTPSDHPVTVTALILLIATIGHGFSASA
ncbi:DnaJ domain-containing protein [Cerioporus squamosus]|nr:DnaJ domain-containing protein [Cerioporus squamosus]